MRRTSTREPPSVTVGRGRADSGLFKLHNEYSNSKLEPTFVGQVNHEITFSDRNDNSTRSGKSHHVGSERRENGRERDGWGDVAAEGHDVSMARTSPPSVRLRLMTTVTASTTAQDYYLTDYNSTLCFPGKNV